MNLIISAKAGMGKTTLIEEATLPFRGRLGGFFTREQREGSERVGFDLLTFDGERKTFASKRLGGAPRVNKYGVDLQVLERFGVAAMREAREQGKVVVIDGIGAMESLSKSFMEEALRCLAGRSPVLATMRSNTAHFAKSAKELSETEIRELNRENFNEVRAYVRAWLERAVQAPPKK